jgi:hypothetical protein
MAQTSVINFKNINTLSDFIITNPKKNSLGKIQAAILSSATKKGIYLESSNLIAPFGISTYDPNNNTEELKKNWTLSIKASPGNGDTQENADTFFDILRNIDEMMIDWGVLNSQMIFNKTYKPEQRGIVEALYQKCVRPSVGKDGTIYPDRGDFKFSRKEDTSPDVLIFKDSNVPIELTSFSQIEALISKGMSIKAIIQPRVFFMPGKFGVTLRIVQLKLPNESHKVGKPVTYGFSDPIVEVSGPIVEVSSKTKESTAKVSNDIEAYDTDVEVDEEDV